jgi:hypothetical protein
MKFEDYLGEVINKIGYVDRGETKPHSHEVGSKVISYHQGTKREGVVTKHVYKANGRPAVEVKTSDGNTHITHLVHKA